MIRLAAVASTLALTMADLTKPINEEIVNEIKAKTT
jgi:hypothetical protein